MYQSALRWIRKRYIKIVTSIAFLPGIILMFFIISSVLMLAFDLSETGKQLKDSLKWFSLKDASTARTIASTIATGIISLAVFSFSMVMIVMNQAASQMSNRILESIIENRFQQTVLGFYIGTISYSLLILSTIRDIKSGIIVPAFSIYLLILLTVIDIFLFIYFLDYVTKAVKFETIIHKVQKETMVSMKKLYTKTAKIPVDWSNKDSVVVESPVSGYLQGFDRKRLLPYSKKLDIHIAFQNKTGSYHIKGSDILIIYGTDKLNKTERNNILYSLDFFNGQPIERNPEFGFLHLTEVAVKALSPGINDPATAVLSLNALSDLFNYRLVQSRDTVILDDEDTPRIKIRSSTFEELFEECIFPIWQYGQKDLFIQSALLKMIELLENTDDEKQHSDLFHKVREKVEKKIEKF